MELSKQFKFEAAHLLPKHPGKCSRLHGHSWVLTVFVEGDIDPESGFVVDYGHISAACTALVAFLDHSYLGETTLEVRGDISKSLNLKPPSSENLLFWIADHMELDCWSKLVLNETCTSSCTLTRAEYDAKRDSQRAATAP